MIFEHDSDVLHWYQSHDRALTKDFLDAIPWHEVKKYPLPEAFVPVIQYMRDIETFTSIYFDELMRTPTGRDPIIGAFMERWVTEEPLHGELLNRFLEEANVPVAKTWKQDIFKEVPASYTRETKLITSLTNLVGKKFTAVHMTWGAINELSTLSAYQRLWQMAKHPVLEKILRAIGREESKHYFFYWSVARIHLAKSRFARGLSRFLIDKFWSPVGEGTKPIEESNVVIRTLFGGEEGVRYIDQFVNQMIAKLPGFEGSTRVTDRVSSVVL